MKLLFPISLLVFCICILPKYSNAKSFTTENDSILHPRGKDSISNNQSNTYYDDAGSWVGIGLGFHTNAGPIYEKLAIMIRIEYRTKSILCFPLEYTRWWSKQDKTKDQELDFYGSLSIGLKIRVNLFKTNVFGQVGIGTGVQFGKLSSHYAVGMELPLWQIWGISLQIRRTTYTPSCPFFLLLGINVRS